MLDFISKESCTGCNACYNICPQSAIKMVIDKEGFWYPKVSKEKCNFCGLCEKVCPTLNKYKRQDNVNEPIIYAAWSLDEKTRNNSTSGGIFTEVASTIIDQGGYVVGAIYNKNHHVEHYIARSKEELERLRQSKYLQSYIGDIFIKVRTLLADGNIVLFCGTPCQVAGLRCFLRKEYKNLLLCDFICRGVNSPKAYEKYLDMLRYKYKSEIKYINFKNKKYGWNRFSTLVGFVNGKEYIEDRYNDLFMKGYLKYNLYLRPSCYNCHFKGLPRLSDMTLADFWGIASTRPHLDQDKGTSLVFINSGKGKDMFNSISKNIFSEQCTLEEAERGNGCIYNSVELNSRRDAFFLDLEKMQFDKLIRKYSKNNFISKIRYMVLDRISSINK